jgi:hypothetical protein
MIIYVINFRHNILTNPSLYTVESILPMKTLIKSTLFLLLICLSGIFLPTQSKAQGRLVINEFLNWPGNSCSATGEFIELMNIGPGPMNIGCYVITDGDYSITIPANTILGPGKFYVLGGMDILPKGCANTTRAVVVNLNWYTCGCTSAPIPTTGNALMTDGSGGGAPGSEDKGEQLVLLNPQGQVIDAVVRKLETIEPSSTITTAAMTNAGCTPFTFDLSTMNITYEIIGEATGNGNSFARETDGNCDWDKETQQNGGDSNGGGTNTTLTMTQTVSLNLNCSSGNVEFTITSPSPATYFPFSYILGFNSDGNVNFTSNDTFTNGTDDTSPKIEINNLALGNYNILLEPATGCNQLTANFEIGPCATMDIKLKKFTGISNGKTNKFSVEIEHENDLKEIQLQSSRDGISFTKAASIPFENRRGLQSIAYSTSSNEKIYYRLGLVDINNKMKYSAIVNLSSSGQEREIRISPNPFSDFISIEHNSEKIDILSLHILSSSGSVMKSERINLRPGLNNLRIPTNTLPKGLYIISMRSMGNNDTKVTRVIKG